MAKTPTYTEVFVLRISEQQKQTLDKIRERGFVVQKFVREAVKEKINREYKELKQKTKKEKVPF